MNCTNPANSIFSITEEKKEISFFSEIKNCAKDLPFLFASDQFLQWGILHKIIDETGTLLNPTLFDLPPLEEEEKKVLQDFFSQEIEMNFSSGQERYKKEVKFTMRDLLSFIAKELNGLEIDEIELIGSSVFWLLKDFFKRSFAFIFKEYSKEAKETGPALLDTSHKPFDVDIRLGSFTQSQLSNYLEAIFKYLVDKIDKNAFVKKNEYIDINKGRYPFLKKTPKRFVEVFIKEEGLSKFKQVNDEVNGNILDIIGFGKSFRIELIAYVKLQKTSLCRYDALHLDIVDFLLNQQEDGFKISGHNQAQAFIDLFTNNLCLTDLSKARARDVLILLSRMARTGGRCIQLCLDQLYSLYVKERPDLSGTKEDVQNIFYAHHHKTMEEARNYLWSICLFFSGRREINSKYLLDLWNSAALFDLVDSKESAFFACIHHLLNQKGCSFTFISSWMQMAAFINLSLFNGRGVNHQMLLTLHDGKPAIRFQNGSLFFYLPFDLQNALKEIENSLSFIPYELLEFLLPQQIKPNVQMKEEVAKLKIDLAIFEKAFALVGAKDDKIGPWFQALLLFYIPDRNQFIEFLQRESLPSIFLGSIQYYLDPKNIWKSLPALLEIHKEKIHLPLLTEELLQSFLKEKINDDEIFYCLSNTFEQMKLTKLNEKWNVGNIKESYALKILKIFEENRYISTEDVLRKYIQLFNKCKDSKNNSVNVLIDEIYFKMKQCIVLKRNYFSEEYKKIIERDLLKIIRYMINKMPNSLNHYILISSLLKQEIVKEKNNEFVSIFLDSLKGLIKEIELKDDLFYLSEWKSCIVNFYHELVQFSEFSPVKYFFAKIFLRNKEIENALLYGLDLIDSNEKKQQAEIFNFIQNCILDLTKIHNSKEINPTLIKSILLHSQMQIFSSFYPEESWKLHLFYINNLMQKKERKNLLDCSIPYLNSFIILMKRADVIEYLIQFSRHLIEILQLASCCSDLSIKISYFHKFEECSTLLIPLLIEKKLDKIIFDLINSAMEHKLIIDLKDNSQLIIDLLYKFIQCESNEVKISENFLFYIFSLINDKNCIININNKYFQKLIEKKQIEKSLDYLQKNLEKNKNPEDYISIFCSLIKQPAKKTLIPKVLALFSSIDLYNQSEYKETFLTNILENSFSLNYLIEILIDHHQLFAKLHFFFVKLFENFIPDENSLPLYLRFNSLYNFTNEYAKIKSYQTYAIKIIKLYSSLNSAKKAKEGLLFFWGFYQTQEQDKENVLAAGWEMLIRNLQELNAKQLATILDFFYTQLNDKPLDNCLKKYPPSINFSPQTTFSHKKFGDISSVLGIFIKKFPIFVNQFKSDQDTFDDLDYTIRKIFLDFHPEKFDSQFFAYIIAVFCIQEGLQFINYMLKSSCLNSSQKALLIFENLIILLRRVNENENFSMLYIIDLENNQKVTLSKSFVNDKSIQNQLIGIAIECLKYFQQDKININSILNIAEWLLEHNLPVENLSIIEILLANPELTQFYKPLITKFFLKELNNSKSSTTINFLLNEYILQLKFSLETSILLEDEKIYIYPWDYLGEILSHKNIRKFLSEDEYMNACKFINDWFLLNIKKSRQKNSFQLALSYYAVFLHREFRPYFTNSWGSIDLDIELEPLKEYSLYCWETIIFHTLQNDELINEFEKIHSYYMDLLKKSFFNDIDKKYLYLKKLYLLYENRSIIFDVICNEYKNILKEIKTPEGIEYFIKEFKIFINLHKNLNKNEVVSKIFNELENIVGGYSTILDELIALEKNQFK